MMELHYKTLVLKHREGFAHPREGGRPVNEWLLTSYLPMLVNEKTTIEDLQKIYPSLDFGEVELIDVKLTYEREHRTDGSQCWCEPCKIKIE